MRFGAKAGGWADIENSAWWCAEWLKLARRFIGIEREHEYFHGIAVPRVTGAQTQERLFEDAKVGALR